jgi:outer membrane protein
MPERASINFYQNMLEVNSVLHQKLKRLFVLILMVLSLPILSFPVLAAENRQTPASTLLSLQQSLDLALKNNKQIKAKEKEVVIAKAAVKEAEAGFGPTLNYQAERDQSDLPQYEIGALNYQKTKLTGVIMASKPLYTGGILEKNLQLTKIQLAVAQETAKKARQQLIHDVKQAYYQVWLAKQLVQVQQASYDNLDQHVGRMQSRYRAEVASRLDVLRAQTQRDTLKPKVIKAQNQLALAKLQLAMLIGYPAEAVYEVQDEASQVELPQTVGFTLKKVLERAYQDRPELHQLEKMAESNRILTAMKKAVYKPNVSLSAGYGGLKQDLNEGEFTGAWMLTLTVGGKIYDRAIQAKIDQAKGEEEVTALQIANTRDQIRLEAEQSLQNLAAAIETTRASQANINFARETLRMTQIRVDNGMATTMDIMDAQLALDQALTGYYQGEVAYLTALVKLDLVMGKN